ncbi:hypothetical protein GCM10011588_33840 [Nocardia jinanensis]|uniref:Uncharacterized protein n=1 Tax=Nocardia jinanensis TaxID=382504 RepID=A0A917RPC6_9NOCA|nr:hypothetical protein GCM10011588_33840 [Nocardia jinanensis]
MIRCDARGRKLPAAPIRDAIHKLTEIEVRELIDSLGDIRAVLTAGTLNQKISLYQNHQEFDSRGLLLPITRSGASSAARQQRLLPKCSSSHTIIRGGQNCACGGAAL